MLPQLRHSLFPERYPIGDDPMTYVGHSDTGPTAEPGSASGLPECSEISQSPLDFTKIFTAYTG